MSKSWITLNLSDLDAEGISELMEKAEDGEYWLKVSGSLEEWKHWVAIGIFTRLMVAGWRYKTYAIISLNPDELAVAYQKVRWVMPMVRVIEFELQQPLETPQHELDWYKFAADVFAQMVQLLLSKYDITVKNFEDSYQRDKDWFVSEKGYEVWKAIKDELAKWFIKKCIYLAARGKEGLQYAKRWCGLE